MPLKQQLLLISLLFLALPWAGCQFVREVESALRQGQEQSLEATATAIASVLQADHSVLELLRRDGVTRSSRNNSKNIAIVFEPAPLPVVVDGYADEEWDGARPLTIQAEDFPDQNVSYRAMSREGRLYLFFEVKDQDINYFNPAKPDGSDQLIIVLGGSSENGTAEQQRNAPRAYSVVSSTPGKSHVGKIKDGKLEGTESAINAFWQDTIGGYNIELSIPLTLSERRIGFFRHDVNRNNNLLEYGTIASTTTLIPRAVYSPENLTQRLNLFAQPGQRLGIVDRNGLAIADLGSINGDHQEETPWALRRLYSTILKLPQLDYVKIDTNAPQRIEISAALSGQTDHAWYRGVAYSNRSILSTAAPISSENSEVVGALYVEQSSEEFLALTDAAFTRIFLISFAALLAATIGLLAYASWLSLRIRRLSQAAERAIADDGSVRSQFPHTQAQDEIGDLSRSYESLVMRVQEYTEYLQSLSGKLSHELRTPLAVVHTSLDNLDREDLSASAATYLHRAKDGALKLSHILSAMSEATRVEESISSAEMERCNLLKLLEDISLAYADLFRQHKIEFINNSKRNSMELQLAPELIAQLLDKLLENAVDFAPKGSNIEISLSLREQNALITVSNEGEPLNETMQTQLFQKMVSMRSEKSGGMHLGLGLHIVKLIAEFHGGQVQAYNLVNNIGVCFELSLPLDTAAATPAKGT